MNEEEAKRLASFGCSSAPLLPEGSSDSYEDSYDDEDDDEGEKVRNIRLTVLDNNIVRYECCNCSYLRFGHAHGIEGNAGDEMLLSLTVGDAGDEMLLSLSELPTEELRESFERHVCLNVIVGIHKISWEIVPSSTPAPSPVLPTLLEIVRQRCSLFAAKEVVGFLPNLHTCEGGSLEFPDDLNLW